MTQFKVGKYKCVNGAFALVRRLKVYTGEWYLSGAIGDKGSNVMLLMSWNLEGKCVTDAQASDRFNLVPNDE